MEQRKDSAAKRGVLSGHLRDAGRWGAERLLAIRASGDIARAASSCRQVSLDSSRGMEILEELSRKGILRASE